MVAITICNLQVLLVDLIGLAQVGKVTGTLTQTAMVDVTCTKLVFYDIRDCLSINQPS